MPTGMTATEQQAAADSGQELIDSRNEAMVLAAFSTPALTPSASALQTALMSNAGYRADMNYLYGTTYDSTGSRSSFDNTTLNSVVAQSGYNQTDYLTDVTLSAGLLRALRANLTVGTNFNRAYAATLAASGTPGSTDRGKLFAQVNKTAYGQTDFINIMSQWPTGTANQWDLAMVFQGNSSYRTHFNTLYVGTIPDSGTISTTDRNNIIMITGSTDYVKPAYLAKIQSSYNLLVALRANTTQRNAFNTRYTATIQSSGNLATNDRYELFAAVTQSGYNQATFLASLCSTCTGPVTLTPASTSLVSVLYGNSGYRADMNLLYGTAITSTGTSSDFDRSSLNSITSQSGYSQTDFLGDLTRAASLYRALQANLTQRTNFNTRYSEALPASGSPSSSGRAELFYQVNVSGYVQSTFLSTLNTVIPPGSGRLFSATSFWNTRMGSTNTVKSNSSILVNELIRNTTLAAPWINSSSYSTPYYEVTSSTPKVPLYIVKNGVVLTSTNLHKETIRGVPLPANVQAAGGTDGHLTIYDKSTDTLYEFWKFKRANGRWEATWGGIIHNASTSNGAMPVVRNASGGLEYQGATATGLPAIAGTMMLKELQAGVIPHALAFAIPQPKRSVFVSPATRTDGMNTSANAIPEGTRFRLPANVYINPSWSPIMKMMVTAIRDYGMILRDVAGAVSFYAEDRTQYGTSNPYTTFYGGKQLWDVMKEMPWSQLQAVN